VVTSNNTFVSQWRDQSGNGNHFSQATEANQPIYNHVDDGYWEGKPSLEFDGVGTFLDSDKGASTWRFLHDGTGGGAIIVYRPAVTGTELRLLNSTTGTPTGVFISGMTGTDLFLYRISNGSTTIVFNGAFGTVDTVPTWGFVAYEEGRAGNEWTVSKNGQASPPTGDSSGAPDTGDPDAPLRIGASTSGAQPMDGEIVEVIAELRRVADMGDCSL